MGSLGDCFPRIRQARRIRQQYHHWQWWRIPVGGRWGPNLGIRPECRPNIAVQVIVSSLTPQRQWFIR